MNPYHPGIEKAFKTIENAFEQTPVPETPFSHAPKETENPLGSSRWRMKKEDGEKKKETEKEDAETPFKPDLLLTVTMPYTVDDFLHEKDKTKGDIVSASFRKAIANAAFEDKGAENIENVMILQLSQAEGASTQTNQAGVVVKTKLRAPDRQTVKGIKESLRWKDSKETDAVLNQINEKLKAANLQQATGDVELVTPLDNFAIEELKAAIAEDPESFWGIADVDASRDLTLDQFVKACKDWGIDNTDLELLFNSVKGEDSKLSISAFTNGPFKPDLLLTVTMPYTVDDFLHKQDETKGDIVWASFRKAIANAAFEDKVAENIENVMILKLSQAEGDSIWLNQAGVVVETKIRAPDRETVKGIKESLRWKDSKETDAVLYQINCKLKAANLKEAIEVMEPVTPLDNFAIEELKAAIAEDPESFWGIADADASRDLTLDEFVEACKDWGGRGIDNTDLELLFNSVKGEDSNTKTLSISAFTKSFSLKSYILPPASVKEAIGRLWELEVMLAKEGRVNTYVVSTLAFLHSTLLREVEQKLNPKDDGEDFQYIWQVIEHHRAERELDYDLRGRGESKRTGTSEVRQEARLQEKEQDKGKVTNNRVLRRKDLRAHHMNRLVNVILEFLIKLGNSQVGRYQHYENYRESQRIDKFYNDIEKKLTDLKKMDLKKWTSKNEVEDKLDNKTKHFVQVDRTMSFHSKNGPFFEEKFVVSDSGVEFKDSGVETKFIEEVADRAKTDKNKVEIIEVSMPKPKVSVVVKTKVLTEVAEAAGIKTKLGGKDWVAVDLADIITEQFTNTLENATKEWCGISTLQDRIRNLKQEYPNFFETKDISQPHDLVFETKDQQDEHGGKKEKPQRLLCQVVTLKKELKVKRNHEGEWNWEDLENVVKILKQEKDKWKKREKRFHEVKWGDKQKSGYSGFNDNIDSRTSDALSELLRAEATFSAGLDDLRKLRQIINTVARSKLMMGQTTGLKGNSLEALSLLQRAWEMVDIYTYSAQWHKSLAKMIYFLLLFIGFVTVLLTTLWLNFENNPAIDDMTFDLDTLVIIMMLSNSVIIAVLTFFNPMAKWSNLRKGALALESEIWKFRTRTGIYAEVPSITAGGSRTKQKQPERNLRAMIEEISNNVQKAASVSHSSFFSKFDGLFSKPKNAEFYRHGQYQKSNFDGTYGTHGRWWPIFSDIWHPRKIAPTKDGGPKDDHHSPLAPSSYLELRVCPMIVFYQRRLPGYQQARILFETLLVSSSIAGTVLAFLGRGSWAGITSALTAAVTAYAKFTGLDKKMQNYSDTISGISSVLLWWRSLTDVEQANPALVYELVDSCERIFAAERSAWVSTAMASSKRLNAMRRKPADEDDDEEGKT